MWCTVFLLPVLGIITYLLKQLSDTGPNKVKYCFYYFMYYFCVSLLALVIWPYFVLSPKNVKNPKVASRLLKHITKIYGLEWQLRNEKILSEERGAVIICNHQNSLDVLGMFNIWEIVDKLTVIAKKELFYIWPFGLCAYLGGVVFIDRRNAKGAYKQLEVTSDIMVNNKTKIWFFPEGTRNKTPSKLLPFKKGAFNTAVAAQVPIIPVVFSPYYFINSNKYIFNSGRIIIQCLEPIPTVGLTTDNVPELMNQAYEKMSEAFKELSKEVIDKLPSDNSITHKGIKG